jgi:tetratricopeptide (TPR) repeat protein
VFPEDRGTLRFCEAALLALAVIQGAFLLGAQVPERTQKDPSPSFSLPESCQSAAGESEPLARLVKNAAIHPSCETFDALGLQLAKREQYACAMAAFEAALRLDPNSWEVRYNLALTLAHAGDQKRAANELRSVIQQKPDYLPARNALGLALQSLGELDAAAEQFQAALRIDLHSPAAAFSLARVFQSQKKYAAEIYYLRQALASNPPRQLDFQVRLALGAAEDQMGHADKAVRELLKLVAAFPDSSEAHYNLANAYTGHLRFKEARVEYEQTLRLDPGNNAARLSLAKALLEIGENSAAIPIIEGYLQRASADYEGYLVLGQAYRREGDLAKAEKQFRRAMELNADSYDARYLLGIVLAGTARPEEASRQLEIAEKVNPRAPGAHYELSVLYAKNKDPKRSQEEAKAFQQARDQGEKARTFDLLRIKGDDFLRSGDAQDAATTYRKAIELNPDDPGMHYNLSLALAKLGDTPGEKEELENAVKLGPNVPEPHNQLGAYYLAEGKIAEAEQQFKSAIAVNPAFAEAKNNLGTLYGRMGNNRAAMELFREAVQNAPEFAQAHANLGLIMAAEGNFAAATQELQEALRFEPKNTTALAGLRMVKAQESKAKSGASAREQAN